MVKCWDRSGLASLKCRIQGCKIMRSSSISVGPAIYTHDDHRNILQDISTMACPFWFLFYIASSCILVTSYIHANAKAQSAFDFHLLIQLMSLREIFGEASMSQKVSTHLLWNGSPILFFEMVALQAHIVWAGLQFITCDDLRIYSSKDPKQNRQS